MANSNECNLCQLLRFLLFVSNVIELFLTLLRLHIHQDDSLPQRFSIRYVSQIFLALKTYFFNSEILFVDFTQFLVVANFLILLILDVLCIVLHGALEVGITLDLVHSNFLILTQLLIIYCSNH